MRASLSDNFQTVPDHEVTEPLPIADGFDRGEVDPYAEKPRKRRRKCRRLRKKPKADLEVRIEKVQSESIEKEPGTQEASDGPISSVGGMGAACSARGSESDPIAKRTSTATGGG